MKTKLFSLLFAIMASIGTLFARDYEHVQIGELYYNLDSENHSAEVTYAEYANENNYAGLTTIDVPASIIYMNETYSVDSIEDNAFRECSILTSVYIPSSITKIAGNIFFGCNNLSSVIVSDENPRYDSRDNCNAIIETATNCLVAACPATNIPSDIEILGAYCFGGLSTITYIDLPESLTTIEDGAFTYCTSLGAITIPKNVSHIGSVVFAANNLLNITVDSENTTYNSRNWCQAIILTETNTLLYGCQNTIIPDNVTSIARYAFAKCSALTSITISEGVKHIGYAAFQGCENLQSLVIPDNVVTIELDAFTDCTGLTSVEIGSGLDTVTDPFRGCANIASIKVSDANNKFDSRDNCNAIIETATNTLIRGCKNTIIPNSVTCIGDDAFYGCSTLTTIDIPNSITSIKMRAFDGCSSLDSIAIPEGITKICSATFFGCTSLKSFIIPKNVTEIEGTAFYNCTGLTSFTCKAITPPSMRALEVFYNVDKSIPLYVPAESIDAYKAASQWNEFTNIRALPSSGGDKPLFPDDPGTLTLNLELTAAVVDGDTIAGQAPAGGGGYPEGTELTITAQDIPGYEFVQWSDSVTDKTRTIVLNESMTLVAYYTRSMIEIAVAANQWMFICLPPLGDRQYTEDMFTYDGLTGVKWGTYNGTKRATGQSGWETAETFNAMQGYIIYSTTAGMLRINAYQDEIRQGESSDNIAAPLNAYEASHTENASWNFLGNPYAQGFNIAGLVDAGIESPITVWNGTGYSTYTPGIDDYTLQPFEAFFIQKAETAPDAIRFIR